MTPYHKKLLHCALRTKILNLRLRCEDGRAILHKHILALSKERCALGLNSCEVYLTVDSINNEDISSSCALNLNLTAGLAL